MSELVLIRHAAVEVRPLLPAETWTLSAVGRQAASDLSRHPAIRAATVIASSPEAKAKETAEAFAGSRPVHVVDGLRELDRRAAGWLGDDAYGAMIAEIFLHPEQSVEDCESGQGARERFAVTVAALRAAHPGQSLAVVAHGIVLHLYLAHLRGESPNLTRWRGMRFPDVAVIDQECSEVLLDFGH